MNITSFKKIICLILALIMAVCVIGCGDTEIEYIYMYESDGVPGEVGNVEDGNSTETEPNKNQNNSSETNSSKNNSSKTTSSKNTSNTSSKKGTNSSDKNSSISSVVSSVVSYPSVSQDDLPKYKPTSLTVSFYDTSKSSYGFTWNTKFIPLKSAIQICEGSTFNESKCVEYDATVTTELVNYPNQTTIYISKAVATLRQGMTYTYRAYDKGAKIGSDITTFNTADFAASEFTFVHVSDSQVSASGSDEEIKLGAGTGSHFANTLTGIFKNKPSFLLHTGDIVEYSKYETYWENMLHTNASFLTSLPFMPLSGNHETTYRSGSNEIFKHFNLKIPSQQTQKGFYYDFDYGNVKFIMLNTNCQEDEGLEKAQYNWLVNTLKSNSKKWTIVSMHHPMYSIGKWGSNPEQNASAIRLTKQLSSLFTQYGVDLVLQGHDHTYSKTYPIKSDGTPDTNYEQRIESSVKYAVNPKGTIYAMHGPGGSQTRSPYSSYNKSLYEIAAASKASSWAEIKVEQNRLTVKIKYYANGTENVFDSYGIIKE